MPQDSARHTSIAQTSSTPAKVDAASLMMRTATDLGSNFPSEVHGRAGSLGYFQLPPARSAAGKINRMPLGTPVFDEAKHEKLQRFYRKTGSIPVVPLPGTGELEAAAKRRL
jgi:hypothetical protein